MKKIKNVDFESKAQSSKLKDGSSKFKVQSSEFEIEAGGLRLRFSQVVFFSLALLILPTPACVNQSLLKNSKNVAAVVEENDISDFQRDLQTMKTANFDFIFAFRRADGAAFDSEDKKYLRANTPPGTNRFISTDQNRAFIAGSLYAFSPENLSALQNRFQVEDYSKPESERQNTNQNTNANR